MPKCRKEAYSKGLIIQHEYLVQSTDVGVGAMLEEKVGLSTNDMHYWRIIVQLCAMRPKLSSISSPSNGRGGKGQHPTHRPLCLHSIKSRC